MNSPSPHRGKIFFYKKFPFNDGGESDKLLITVNEPNSTSDWVFIKTTSKLRSPDTQGCHSINNFYVLNAKEDFFSQKTWIQFHEIHKIPNIALSTAIKFGEANRIGILKPQTMRAIINCMHGSPDLSPAELKCIKN